MRVFNPAIYSADSVSYRSKSPLGALNASRVPLLGRKLESWENQHNLQNLAIAILATRASRRLICVQVCLILTDGHSLRLRPRAPSQSHSCQTSVLGWAAERARATESRGCRRYGFDRHAPRRLVLRGRSRVRRRRGPARSDPCSRRGSRRRPNPASSTRRASASWTRSQSTFVGGGGSARRAR